MAAGDLIRVSFEHQVAGQDCVNVLHLVQGSAPAMTMQEVAEDLATKLPPVFRLIHSTSATGNVVYRGVRCQTIVQGFSDVGEFPINTQGTGQSVSPLAPTLAVVFTLRTDQGGRSRRGRIYIGGAGVQQEGGFVQNTDIPKLDAFATSLLTNFGSSSPASGYRLGVFSRKTWNTSHDQTTAWRAVQVITPQRVLGTMRSRRPGVGI